MPFAWLRRRRRRRLLARPWNEEDLATLEALRFAVPVPEAAKPRWRDIARILEAEIHWEGRGGLQVTRAMRFAVAGSAARMAIGLPDGAFDRVRTVLLAPDDFRPSEPPVDELGIVHVDARHIGEAWHEGIVLLSWDEVAATLEEPGVGQDVVVHEFAHQLDLGTDSWFDGTPDLATEAERVRWREVMQREYDTLVAAVERGAKTFLDPYGATNASEFFAVVSEELFDRPRGLAARHPELYAVLAAFYGQDPAGALA